MRVLHVLNSLAGGATQSVIELVAASRRLGSDIQHYLVYPGRPGEPPDPRLSRVCAGARPVPLAFWNRDAELNPFWRAYGWVRTAQLTALQRRSRSLLRRLVRDWSIDVVHTNSCVIKEGAVMARQLGLPHVWHIRERLGHNGFITFSMGDAAAADFIASRASTVAVISRYVQEFFSRHGHESATRLVFDGIDLDRFTGEQVRLRALEMRRRWGISDDALLVGTVGTPAVSVKLQDVFIRTAGILARRFIKARFVVLGSLPVRRGWIRDLPYTVANQRFERLRQLAVGEGLERAFLWAGYAEDIAAAMSAFDVVVHTCSVEAFSRTVLEAMAAGRPVVAPMAGGSPEAVIDGETGFLAEPGKPESFAEATGVLLADAGLRRRFGDAAREVVASRFSAETHHARMQAIFEGAAGSRS